MGAIIGLIVSLAPSVIQLVEGLFGHGQGQSKADTVNAAITALLKDLQAKGTLPGTLDPAQIATVIETIFQQMNASGQVNNPVLVPNKGGDFILTFKGGLMQSVG